MKGFIFAVAALLPLTLASPEPKPKTKATCGSRNLPPCQYGYTCVAISGSKCGPELDCGGYCSTLPPPNPTSSKKPKATKKTTKKPTSTTKPTPSPTPEDPISCGGFRPDPPQCPTDQICQIPPSSICFDGQVVDCAGECVGQSCGGFTAGPQKPCPKGQICVSRPDKPSFISDLPGICVFDDTYCAGFTGRDNCPKDWECVDRPDDTCDPTNGGADCPGVCSFNKGVGGNAGGDGPVSS